MRLQVRLSITALAAAVVAVPASHGNRVVIADEVIQSDSSDAANDVSDDPPGTEAVESPSEAEEKASGNDGKAEPGTQPPTRSEEKQQKEQWDNGLGGKVLRDLPPAEELRRALAEKYDLSELGGESPRAVTKAILEGIFGGNVEKVITAHDLTTKGDIVTAMCYAIQAELTRRYLQLYSTIKRKFGNEGLQVMTDMSHGHPEAQELQRRWQKDEVAVDEAVDSAVNVVLDAMEIHYKEDGQKAVAKPKVKELEGFAFLVPRDHLLVQLEMHQRNGRWYAGAEDPTLPAVGYQLTTAIVLPAVAKLIEIVEKAETAEQLRQELEALAEETTFDDGADMDDKAGEASGADAEPDGKATSVGTGEATSSGDLE